MKPRIDDFLLRIHERYPRFFDHGAAEAFRQGLNRLRRQYDDRREGRATPDSCR